jgi:hypothetical protein
MSDEKNDRRTVFLMPSRLYDEAEAWGREKGGPEPWPVGKVIRHAVRQLLRRRPRGGGA